MIFSWKLLSSALRNLIARMVGCWMRSLIAKPQHESWRTTASVRTGTLLGLLLAHCNRLGRVVLLEATDALCAERGSLAGRDEDALSGQLLKYRQNTPDMEAYFRKIIVRVDAALDAGAGMHAYLEDVNCVCLIVEHSVGWY